jgi:TetR/AcrR family transcriptional regulator
MRTHRLKAQDRRKSILQLSKRLFARYGLHGVSVDEVARTCKISPAVLYQHFSSKKALYKAVLNEFACSREEFVDAVLTGSTEFGEVLYRMMSVYIEGRIKDTDSVQIELRSIIDGDKVSETFFQNQWKGFTDYIEASLAELVAEKKIPPIDGKLAALCYVGMLRELIIARALNVGDMRANRALEPLLKDIHKLFLRLVGFGK